MAHKDPALEIMEAHKGLIIKLIRAFPLRYLEQDDLWQEIYLHVHKALPDFRGEAKHSTWLYRIAMNTLLMHKRRDERDLRDHFIKEESYFQRYPETQQLYAALYSLSEADRSIIIMYLEGFDQKEIAEAFHLKANAVGVKIHRIKQKLKSWVENN
jgi:RNA polymerase sigma-70 factor (ECF subfamily)